MRHGRTITRSVLYEERRPIDRPQEAAPGGGGLRRRRPAPGRQGCADDHVRRRTVPGLRRRAGRGVAGAGRRDPRQHRQRRRPKARDQPPGGPGRRDPLPDRRAGRVRPGARRCPRTRAGDGRREGTSLVDQAAAGRSPRRLQRGRLRRVTGDGREGRRARSRGHHDTTRYGQGVPREGPRQPGRRARRRLRRRLRRRGGQLRRSPQEWR